MNICLGKCKRHVKAFISFKVALSSDQITNVHSSPLLAFSRATPARRRRRRISRRRRWSFRRFFSPLLSFFPRLASPPPSLCLLLSSSFLIYIYVCICVGARAARSLLFVYLLELLTGREGKEGLRVWLQLHLELDPCDAVRYEKDGENASVWRCFCARA